MNTSNLRSAVIGLLLGLVMTGCGAGRTMVMEAPAERRTIASATGENGSGAFGGSMNSAVDKAAVEIAEYAVANFH